MRPSGTPIGCFRESASPRAICLARPTSRSASSIRLTARVQRVRHLWNGCDLWRCRRRLDRDRRPGPGVLGTVVAERRTVRADNPGGDPASCGCRRSTRKSRHSWPRRLCHRPMSTAGFVSWAMRGGPSPRTMNTWSWRYRRRSAAFTRISPSRLRAEACRRARTRDPRAQTGGVGPASRAGPGAAIPGHGRGHPAHAGHRGRIALVNRYALRRPRMDGRRVAGARLDRDVPSGPERGTRSETKFRDLLAGDLSVVENPVLTRSGEERLDRVAQQADAR